MLRDATSYFTIFGAGEQLVLKLGSKFIHFCRLKVNRARSLGTVAPSSRFLARDMVTELKGGHGQNDDLVVELGPGDGAITRHILSSVQDQSSVVPIEISSDSVAKLKRKFPVVNAVNDSAANLEKYVPEHKKVRAIISGLPLRVMPQECVHQIGEAIHKVMGPESIYVQYTYDLRPKRGVYFKKGDFKKIRSKIVWRNLPPARVDVFVKS
jgi:phosphatidylethanolamine/phosphatidyl-N-methylethanolamine N-methyltransferase